MSENTSYTAELDEESRSRVVVLVEEGKMHLKKSADEIIEFGKVLIQLKGLLPHGQFIECVESEYGITDATANNYMNVAKRLSDKSQMILDLPASVLYMLASPSCPGEILDQVLLKHGSGEKVKAKEVRELIEKHRIAKEADEMNFFDKDLDELDRKEMEVLEKKIKAKYESLITNAERLEKQLFEIHRKIKNKDTFSQRIQMTINLKGISDNARRVLSSLLDPENFIKNLGLKV